jgi:hypothetical protein
MKIQVEEARRRSAGTDLCRHGVPTVAALELAARVLRRKVSQPKVAIAAFSRATAARMRTVASLWPVSRLARCDSARLAFPNRSLRPTQAWSIGHLTSCETRVTGTSGAWLNGRGGSRTPQRHEPHALSRGCFTDGCPSSGGRRSRTPAPKDNRFSRPPPGPEDVPVAVELLGGGPGVRLRRSRA